MIINEFDKLSFINNCLEQIAKSLPEEMPDVIKAKISKQTDKSMQLTMNSLINSNEKYSEIQTKIICSQIADAVFNIGIYCFKNKIDIELWDNFWGSVCYRVFEEISNSSFIHMENPEDYQDEIDEISNNIYYSFFNSMYEQISQYEKSFNEIPKEIINKFNWGSAFVPLLWMIYNGGTKYVLKICFMVWALIIAGGYLLIWQLKIQSPAIIIMFLLWCALIGSIIIGKKGNELAWKHKPYYSVAQFNEIQRGWAIGGAVTYFLGVLSKLPRLLHHFPDLMNYFH